MNVTPSVMAPDPLPTPPGRPRRTGASIVLEIVALIFAGWLMLSLIGEPEPDADASATTAAAAVDPTEAPDRGH